MKLGFSEGMAAYRKGGEGRGEVGWVGFQMGWLITRGWGWKVSILVTKRRSYFKTGCNTI